MTFCLHTWNNRRCWCRWRCWTQRWGRSTDGRRRSPTYPGKRKLSSWWLNLQQDTSTVNTYHLEWDIGIFCCPKTGEKHDIFQTLTKCFFHGTIIVIWLSACFHGQNSDDWHWIAQQNAKNIKVRFNCFSCFSTSVYSQCINLT